MRFCLDFGLWVFRGQQAAFGLWSLVFGAHLWRFWSLASAGFVLGFVYFIIRHSLFIIRYSAS